MGGNVWILLDNQWHMMFLVVQSGEVFAVHSRIMYIYYVMLCWLFACYVFVMFLFFGEGHELWHWAVSEFMQAIHLVSLMV